jgi:DNA-directed RNA polymerase specialized sigma subunit
MNASQYYRERNRLRKEHLEERELLLAHGISEEEIADLHQADLRAFNGERQYQRNTVSLDGLSAAGVNPLAGLACQASADALDRVGGFLEQIESEQLYYALKVLKKEDLDLVEAVCFGGMRIGEYADQIGVSAQAVSKRMKKILKNLKYDMIDG